MKSFRKILELEDFENIQDSLNQPKDNVNFLPGDGVHFGLLFNFENHPKNLNSIIRLHIAHATHAWSLLRITGMTELVALMKCKKLC